MNEKIIPVSGGRFLAIVDAEDYEILISYGKWSCQRGGHTNYATCKGTSMHRLLMKPPKNMIVDHINHDGLDNRKANLRICSYSENQRNVKPYKKIGNRGIL